MLFRLLEWYAPVPFKGGETIVLTNLSKVAITTAS